LPLHQNASFDIMEPLVDWGGVSWNLCFTWNNSNIIYTKHVSWGDFEKCLLLCWIMIGLQVLVY
jgi:hypothetical protein